MSERGSATNFTSSLSNLRYCLLYWPPPVCAKVLFPLKLIHSLYLWLLSPEAPACVLESCEEDRGEGAVAEDGGHAASCMQDSASVLRVIHHPPARA